MSDNTTQTSYVYDAATEEYKPVQHPPFHEGDAIEVKPHTRYQHLSHGAVIIPSKPHEVEGYKTTIRGIFKDTYEDDNGNDVTVLIIETATGEHVGVDEIIPLPTLFYLDIRSRTFPNGFSSIESAKIVEVYTLPRPLFGKPVKVDEVEAYYFTRRDLAEVALKYHLDKNRDEGGIYGPASNIPASYAAGNRLAQHRAAFEALKNQ